ncbi:MAG: MMPL family transporter [Acidimicrobiales bacterium]
MVAGFTDVSIFALNLTTGMGLGLAIDYSLFVVSRFREELAGGHETAVAVSRTVRTAGRTVVFSAATVAAPLRRFHDRFGFSDHVDLDGPGSAPATDVQLTPLDDTDAEPLVSAGPTTDRDEPAGVS